MRYIAFVLAVVFSCAGIASLRAVEAEQQVEQKQRGCWSCVKAWLSLDEELQRSLTLTACAVVVEKCVLLPMLPSQYTFLACWLGGGTGAVLGSLKISKERFEYVFPKCFAGAVGAFTGSTLVSYVRSMGFGLSDVHEASLAAAGFLVGTQFSTLLTMQRTHKASVKDVELNAAEQMV